jgi:hypothetical protein
VLINIQQTEGITNTDEHSSSCELMPTSAFQYVRCFPLSRYVVFAMYLELYISGTCVS